MLRAFIDSCFCPSRITKQFHNSECIFTCTNACVCVYRVGECSSRFIISLPEVILLRVVFPSSGSDSCQFDQKALNKAVHNTLSKPAKALLLLLKIQFSTATSSLLFPTQSSAAPTHLCSLSLFPLSSSNVFSCCAPLAVFPSPSVSLW